LNENYQKPLKRNVNYFDQVVYCDRYGFDHYAHIIATPENRRLKTNRDKARTGEHLCDVWLPAPDAVRHGVRYSAKPEPRTWRFNGDTAYRPRGR
jgi:hypothetical protein